eukprot:683798-Pelagomonas_calceolata.AAC.2
MGWMKRQQNELGTQALEYGREKKSINRQLFLWQQRSSLDHNSGDLYKYTVVRYVDTPVVPPAAEGCVVHLVACIYAVVHVVVVCDEALEHSSKHANSAGSLCCRLPRLIHKLEAHCPCPA